MPLLTEWLTVWEIAFRWTDRDPDRYWVRLPIDVRDYSRLMMDAIANGRLDCDTLSLNKWTPADGDEMQPHFIRYHWGKIEQFMYGVKYNRALMHWARVERWSFKDWCERQGVPLPEFWFPPGWNLNFRISDEHDEAEDDQDDVKASPEVRTLYQKRRVACQLIATAMWKDEPEKTITAMVKDPFIRKFGGAQYQSEEVVRRWLSAVAPPEVKAKIGRPRKKKGTDDDSRPKP